MRHQEAAGKMEEMLNALSYVKVWSVQSSPNNVSLFCRVDAAANQHWLGVVEGMLRAENDVPVEANGPGLSLFIGRRQMLRNGRFGYTWQVSVWARELGDAIALFPVVSETAVAPTQQTPVPRPKPGRELTEFVLPHRGPNRNIRGLTMIDGPEGPRPSTKGVQGIR